MATTTSTQLEIGMSMENTMSTSRCNQASARFKSRSGTFGTVRFERYVNSTMDDLEKTIGCGPRTALIEDIVAIQSVLLMIYRYGGPPNDGFLASVRSIVSVSEALLNRARQHRAVALMLDGTATIGPSEPRSDEATASSSLSTQVVRDTLANGQLSGTIVAGSDAWTSTLSDTYPQSLDDLSDLSSSSDSEDSAHLSDNTAATSFVESVDGVKAQGLKASPPPALCPT